MIGLSDREIIENHELFAELREKIRREQELEDADDELRVIHKLDADEISALEIELASLSISARHDRLVVRLGDVRSADIAAPYFLRPDLRLPTGPNCLCDGDRWMLDSGDSYERCQTKIESDRFRHRMTLPLAITTGRIACPRCIPNWPR